jgi:hypothetical protein
LESHDPTTVELGRWLRAKSLHSIMIERKMIEMRVEGQTVKVRKASPFRAGRRSVKVVHTFYVYYKPHVLTMRKVSY